MQPPKGVKMREAQVGVGGCFVKAGFTRYARCACCSGQELVRSPLPVMGRPFGPSVRIHYDCPTYLTQNVPSCDSHSYVFRMALNPQT